MTIHGHAPASVIGARLPFSILPACSRITEGIRRAVAALEPHLMRQLSLRPLDEEFGIEGDAAVGLGVELHHPAVEPAVVELRVDRAVKRVGEIDALPVAADLDHLRPTAELAVLRARMAGARDDAADPHLAGEL